MIAKDITKEMDNIQAFLRCKKRRVHLLGVCGVGMAGLAFLLKKKGFEVTGCDLAPNRLAPWLAKHGIPVAAGHDPAHVLKADLLIRTGAVAENNAELCAARRAGKKIFRRGLVLAAISAGTTSICVSGAHGKTTTAAMIAQILRQAGFDPSFCIGGEVPVLGGVAGHGKGNHIVLEADESDGTLAFYRPRLSVITNVDFDHAEHFRDFSALQRCFAAAAGRTRGKIIYCSDDPASRKMFRRAQNAVSCGFSAGANLRLRRWKAAPRGFAVRLETDGKKSGELNLPVPGRHNALNAAMACAAGLELGVPFAVISRALAGFQPAARRFERIIETKKLLILSDYAHHPAEISALVKTARALKRKRLLAVFQPHRYSRTKTLGRLFPPAFRGIDQLILCPVYAASEEKMPGGTSWDLYEKFRQYGKTPTFCASSLKQAWDYLKAGFRPGDGILIIGAGDVVKIAEWAGNEFAGRKTAVFRAQLKSARKKPDVGTWQRNIAKFPAGRLKSSVVKFREPLAQKTTLRVGGSADIFIEADDLTDLALTAGWAAENRVPLRMLGAGSNTLVSDLGARGIVARLKGVFWRKIRLEKNNEITAGAGTSLGKLTDWAAKHGLAGAEFLAGIPGTIGGAVRMNAGAFGREIGGIISRVKIMEPAGNVKTLLRNRLGFAYRRCAGLENRIVLEATLKLTRGNPDVIRKKMDQIRRRKNWMKGMRSAGSVFKNPVGGPAGRVLERLGLKGRKIGGAKISEQHANIITTGKNALASDVLALIEIARDLAGIKRGIDLEREIEYFE
ncbi:MAG: UDP-N-acetylmuramate--L-alanine ligase [Kiritimatiellae bacterium]|nr:UDP-N-acetylmuramate--L-alanine ligase [Kiritimatiellia bacterium]